MDEEDRELQPLAFEWHGYVPTRVVEFIPFTMTYDFVIDNTSVRAQELIRVDLN